MVAAIAALVITYIAQVSGRRIKHVSVRKHVAASVPIELQHFGPRGVASMRVSRVEDVQEIEVLQEEPWYVGECLAEPSVGAFRLAAVARAAGEHEDVAMATIAAFSTVQECAKGDFWPSGNLSADIPIDGKAHPIFMAIGNGSRAVQMTLAGPLQEAATAPRKSCHDFDGDNGGSCLGCISYRGGVSSGMFGGKSNYECSWNTKTRECTMRAPSLKSGRVGGDWATSFHQCQDDKYTKYHGKQISVRAKAWLSEVANRHRYSKLKMVSGLHEIDSKRAQEWKELQCSNLNKHIAQFILDNTHYYNFDAFYEAIKQQFKRFLLKVKQQTGTFNWVLLLHTANKYPESPGKWKKKSNFWIGQLLAQIALEGAALPGGLLGEEAGPGEDPYFPIDVAKNLGDSMFAASEKINYLIVDDAMYTGKQLLTDIGWHTGPRTEEWTDGTKHVYKYKEQEDHFSYFSAKLGDYSYFVNVLVPYTSNEGYSRVTGTFKFDESAFYNFKFECRGGKGKKETACFVPGFTFFYDSFLPDWPNSKAKAHKEYFEKNPAYAKLADAENWPIHARFNGRPHEFTDGNKLVYFDHKIADYVSSLPRVYALGVISPTKDEDADERHQHCRAKPPKLFDPWANSIRWTDGCFGTECNKLFSYPFVKGCFSEDQGVTVPGDSDYWQDLVDERAGGTCQFSFYKKWES